MFREKYDISNSNRYSDPIGAASKKLCSCFKNDCKYDYTLESSDPTYYKNDTNGGIKKCVSNCYMPMMQSIMSKSSPGYSSSDLAENIDSDVSEMHSIIQNKGNCGRYDEEDLKTLNQPYNTGYQYTDPSNPSINLPIYAFPPEQIYDPIYNYPSYPYYPYYPDGNYIRYGPFRYDYGPSLRYSDKRSIGPIVRHHSEKQHRPIENKPQIQQFPLQQSNRRQTQQITRQQPQQHKRQQIQQIQQITRQQPRSRVQGSIRRRENYDVIENINNDNTVCLTHEDYEKLSKMANINN